MIKFPIPPEYCLIINAFSQGSTLRGAASLLEMDPPALVRKVQRISSEYGYLQKVGSRWALTEAGRRVAQWTDEFITSQTKLTEEKSQLRLAAFAWLAEEMLIPRFTELQQSLPGSSFAIKITATDLEQELIQSRSDLVVHGHAPNDPTVAHKKIFTYPWVVVVPYSWKKLSASLSNDELIHYLQKKDFISYSKINSEPLLGFKPEIVSTLTLDGVIGVHAAVASSLGWSLLPAMSVQSSLREKKIFKLNLSTQIKDEVSVWWLRSRRDMAQPAKAVATWISKFQIL